jgi:hypothetical protein
MIKFTTFLIALVIIVGYGVFNSRIFIKGPQLTITSPSSGDTFTDSPLVYITGNANNIAFIDINGRNINTDEDGYFKEAVLLYPGYNVTIISAKDKFERKTERRLELIYKDNSSTTIPSLDSMQLENNSSSTQETRDSENFSTSTNSTTSLEFF